MIKTYSVENLKELGRRLMDGANDGPSFNGQGFQEAQALPTRQGVQPTKT